MNLVLIGYRGTGKSAVARLLGERLGLRVVSLDDEIVRRAGRPIPGIVEQHGWNHFRDLESEVVRDCAAQNGLVVDCGGGVIERPANIEALRRNGRLVWLTASVATIVGRIQGGGERPALTAAQSFTDEVADVLSRRTPGYAAAADFTVNTDRRTPQAVADAVADFWQRQAAQPNAWEPD